MPNKTGQLVDAYVVYNTFQPPKDNSTVSHDPVGRKDRTETARTPVTTNAFGEKILDTNYVLSISVAILYKAIDVTFGGAPTMRR